MENMCFYKDTSMCLSFSLKLQNQQKCAMAEVAESRVLSTNWVKSGLPCPLLTHVITRGVWPVTCVQPFGAQRMNLAWSSLRTGGQLCDNQTSQGGEKRDQVHYLRNELLFLNNF